jgi:hypothetical protein
LVAASRPGNWHESTSLPRLLALIGPIGFANPLEHHRLRVVTHAVDVARAELATVIDSYDARRHGGDRRSFDTTWRTPWQ